MMSNIRDERKDDAVSFQKPLIAPKDVLWIMKIWKNVANDDRVKGAILKLRISGIGV
jgi:hypothetical protein